MMIMIMIARMMPKTYIMTMFTMVDNQEDDGYQADGHKYHNKGHDSLYDYDNDHDFHKDSENVSHIDHLQEVDISKGHDGNDGYDNDDENYRMIIMMYLLIL